MGPKTPQPQRRALSFFFAFAFCTRPRPMIALRGPEAVRFEAPDVRMYLGCIGVQGSRLRWLSVHTFGRLIAVSGPEYTGTSLPKLMSMHNYRKELKSLAVASQAKCSEKQANTRTLPSPPRQARNTSPAPCCPSSSGGFQAGAIDPSMGPNKSIQDH